MFEIKLEDDWLQHKKIHLKEGAVRFLLSDGLRTFEYSSSKNGIEYSDKRYDEILRRLNEKKKKFPDSPFNDKDIHKITFIGKEESEKNSKEYIKQFRTSFGKGHFRSSNYFTFRSKI